MNSAFLFSIVVLSLGADSPKREALPAELAKQADAAVTKAVAYYRSLQLEDGSFIEGGFAPPITGLITTGLLRSKKVTLNDPMIVKALAYLEKQVQPDGGIYGAAGQKNYTTSICALAFAEANKDKRYQKILDGVREFLKKEIWDEGEGIKPSDYRYGGAGYGKVTGPDGKKTNVDRPDLSNTSFWLEAAKATGLDKDDPSFQRALIFITRCQNLSGEGANDLPQAALVNDGGFAYTPAESQAGGNTAKGLRSYGSMTYNGLKSFLYVGVDRNDRRVKAALSWIRKNYTVKENPGLGQEGLYYYYHTFAKALDVLGMEKVEDADGKAHHWRHDLVSEIVAKQQADGSWSNPNKRWLEGDGRVTTAYVLLALSHAVKE